MRHVGFPPLASIREQSDDEQVTEEKISAALAMWIPRAVAAELCVAIIAWLFELPINWLLYGLAACNAFGALLIGMFHFSSKRGSRSVQQLGFERYPEALAYASFPYGIRKTAFVLWGAAVLIMLVTGWTENASGMLAFSTAWLVMAYAAISREWPADHKGS